MGIQNSAKTGWEYGTLQGLPVAREFTQQFGKNYDKTFSPVIRMGMIRIFIAFALAFKPARCQECLLT